MQNMQNKTSFLECYTRFNEQINFYFGFIFYLFFIKIHINIFNLIIIERFKKKGSMTIFYIDIFFYIKLG